MRQTPFFCSNLSTDTEQIDQSYVETTPSIVTVYHPQPLILMRQKGSKQTVSISSTKKSQANATAYYTYSILTISSFIHSIMHLFNSNPFFSSIFSLYVPCTRRLAGCITFPSQLLPPPCPCELYPVERFLEDNIWNRNMNCRRRVYSLRLNHYFKNPLSQAHK